MPTFEAERGGLLWDATAVPNAFFCEYMPAAPEGHVKVYLYGLMCAHGGVQEEGDLLDDVARSLALSRDEVECAMRYWERCRLVERVKDTPPVYRFLSVQQAMLKRREAPRDEAYEAFAQAVYAAEDGQLGPSVTGASSTAAKPCWPTNGWSSSSCPLKWCSCSFST